MTKSARKHLEKAKGYVARGEEFYRKAAEEIVAAQKADPTLSNREIGQWFGRGDDWVRQIVTWSTTSVDHAPFGGPAQDAAQSKSRTRKMLREAPPEQIAEMLAEPEVRAKVSRAQQIATETTERRSREKEREALGAEADDQLREQQTLRNAEGELFKARRATVEMLRLLNSVEGGLTDSWREEFLRTIDDVEGKLTLARSLLTGDLDKDLDELLEMSS